MSKNVLLIFAHTDDETIACGGTIKKLVKNNYKVYAMSFTDGVSSRQTGVKKLKIEKEKRFRNAFKAAKILGFNWIENLDYPDNELDKISLLNLVKEIEKVKKKIKPKIVITHNISDLNVDHRKIAESVITAFRPKYNEKTLKILFSEIPSATDYRSLKNKNVFSPNHFVDIEKEIYTKISALKCYKSEMLKYPNSRSIKGIENLAKFRGNQVGMKFAEAFEIFRSLDK